jgi:carboxylesterase
MLDGDSAAAGLPGNPWPSLAEFYRLSFLVRRQLRSIHTPCLVVHAVDDDVASLRNVRMVVRGVRGPVETVLLENSYHMVTVDQERDKVIDRSVRYFNHIAATRFVHMPEPAQVAVAVD